MIPGRKPAGRSEPKRVEAGVVVSGLFLLGGYRWSGRRPVSKAGAR